MLPYGLVMKALQKQLEEDKQTQCRLFKHMDTMEFQYIAFKNTLEMVQIIFSKLKKNSKPVFTHCTDAIDESDMFLVLMTSNIT